MNFDPAGCDLAWIGFTAATGVNQQNLTISNWTFSEFPSNLTCPVPPSVSSSLSASTSTSISSLSSTTGSSSTGGSTSGAASTSTSSTTGASDITSLNFNGQSILIVRNIDLSSNSLIVNSSVIVEGNVTLESVLALQNSSLTITNGSLLLTQHSDLHISISSGCNNSVINSNGPISLGGLLSINVSSLNFSSGSVTISVAFSTGNITGHFSNVVAFDTKTDSSNPCNGNSYNSKTEYTTNSFSVVISPAGECAKSEVPPWEVATISVLVSVGVVGGVVAAITVFKVKRRHSQRELLRKISSHQ